MAESSKKFGSSSFLETSNTAQRSGIGDRPDSDSSPSKRMRLSTSAVKIFTDGEEKMELIRLKGQVKMLEMKISAMERDVEETHASADRERHQSISAKNTLDARISTLQRELSYVIDRERQALERASEADKLLFEERAKADAKLRKVNEEKRLFEKELSEECDGLRAENQSLHQNYMEERRQVAELRYDNSQMRQEFEALTRQNAEIREEILTATGQSAQLRGTNQELQDELKRFREECAVAMAMREEYLDLRSLKDENVNLKKQMERYKTLSENTRLLKEENSALSEQVLRMQNIQEQLAEENNELKTAIAKTAESLGQQVTFDNLDQLSRHCVDLKNENMLLDQEIQRLNYVLEEKDALAVQTEAEFTQHVSNMELRIASKTEIIQAKEAKCSELENVIAQKERIIDQFRKQIGEICAEWNRVQAENADLKKRLSPDTTAAASQTENELALSPESMEEFKTALDEKDARIEYLESRYGLKLDYDPTVTRIIHMDESPLSIAQKEYADRVKALESENHVLRIRLEEFERLRQQQASSDESMDEDVTSKVAIRLDAEQMNAERKELMGKIRKLEEEKHKQIERMKEAHQTVTREYREVCTLLTGFQLKMKEGGLYVVQSIYEKGRENYFLVQKGEDNKINLLQNEYTPRWMDFVDTYLMTDHSIPAFLAAVTLSLYEKEKETTTQSSFDGASTSSST